MEHYENNCVVCGKILSVRRRGVSKFCGTRCDKELNIGSIERKQWSPLISDGTIGAIGEIKACVYFLERGASVYRSVSQNAPFDLSVYASGRLAAVEVKTGRRSKSGGPVSFSRPKNESPDLVFVSVENEEIPHLVPKTELGDWLISWLFSQ